jgi:hypothetical protein
MMTTRRHDRIATARQTGVDPEYEHLYEATFLDSPTGGWPSQDRP